jgi:hypothetical protein
MLEELGHDCNIFMMKSLRNQPFDTKEKLRLGFKFILEE